MSYKVYVWRSGDIWYWTDNGLSLLMEEEGV